MLVAFQSAMANMKAALDLLDSAGAPADVGAHLDLAICRLEDVISRSDHCVSDVTDDDVK